MKNTKVLISGAGIAGPTLAYWLLRWGLEPTLIDRAPSPRPGGYMIDFWGLGYDVAERMDLLPVLLSDGYRIDELQLVNTHGAKVGGLDGRIFRSATDNRFVSLLRADLARRLYATVEGKVETIFSDSVRTLSEDDRGVDVSFERSKPRRFDLVVGADGLHSAVRLAAFGRADAYERYLGYCAAAFSVAGYPYRNEGAYVSYGVPRRQATRYSLRDGRTGFLLVFAEPSRPAAAHHDTLSHKAAVRRAFDGVGWECGEILDAMSGAEEFYFDMVSQVRMDRWSRGRVALVGDSCFGPSLLAGEGAAFAMAGSYLLAGELKAARGDYERAFRHYQAQFKTFIDAKQKKAETFAAWFAPKTPFHLLLRNMTTRLMTVPFLSDWMMHRFIADRFRLPDYSA